MFCFSMRETHSSLSLEVYSSGLHCRGSSKYEEQEVFVLSEKEPFLNRKGDFELDENFPERISDLKGRKSPAKKFCMWKCLLCCGIPLGGVLATAMCIKSDTSIVKRGTPIGDFLNRHGIYEKVHGLQRDIDIRLSNNFNSKEDLIPSNFKWISNLGIEVYSDYVIGSECRKTTNRHNLLQNIESLKDNDLVYVGDKKCLNFFLEKIRTKVNLLWVFTARISEENIRAIENNSYILNLYADAETNRHKHLTNKIDNIPLGISYRMIYEFPLVTYFRFDFFGSMKQYIKRFNDLFEHLKETHRKSATQPILKVFVDFFGKLIQKDCYMTYLKVNDTTKDLPFNKRKCPRRSYAMYTIKNRISSYEELFYLSEGPKNQFELFEFRSQYGFLLAVPGDNLDCYRIWEGLIFNNIIISKSEPLFDEFLKKHNHQLPIVIIDDYVDITKENLKKWYDQYSPFTSFNNKKTEEYLTLSFWRNYMRNNGSVSIKVGS